MTSSETSEYAPNSTEVADRFTFDDAGKNEQSRQGNHCAPAPSQIFLSGNLSPLNCASRWEPACPATLHHTKLHNSASMYAPTRVAQIARDAAMAEAKRLEAEAAVMETSASTIQGIVVGREARREEQQL